jgi:hypothetical protein
MTGDRVRTLFGVMGLLKVAQLPPRVKLDRFNSGYNRFITLVIMISMSINLFASIIPSSKSKFDSPSTNCKLGGVFPDHHVVLISFTMLTELNQDSLHFLV